MTHPNEDAPQVPSAADKRQRIAKLMARAGLCSRRDAEAWIVAGRVSLNGDVLTSPAVDVTTEDIVLVDGAPLPALDKTRLFLFHKPRGLVTSDHDPEGRATVADFLREHWPEGPRVVTIGRLDINTEGLLLLTNDGGLARTLELPQTGWVRRYRVRAKGTADPAALEALADGVSIDGIDYAGIEAKLDRTQGANVWLTMGLREGKNREIKRVLEHMGLEVNRLIRLSFGPFQLLDLPEGAVEEVRTRVLRDQLGAKLAAQAGVAFDEPQAKAPQDSVKERSAKDRGAQGKGVKDKVIKDNRIKDRSVKPWASQAPRGARPARPEHGTRSSSPRPDGRPERRRRPAEADAPPPLRDRPARGTRKHVSALRAERSENQRSAPRTRIERSTTSDNRQRPVAVERLVRPQPTGPARHRPAVEPQDRRARPAQSDDRRRDGDRTREHRGSASPGPNRPACGPARTPGPARRRDRSDADVEARQGPAKAAGRPRHTSPSAAGKRERIARSGPRRDDRAPREGRPDAPGNRASDRASRGKRDDRAARPDRDDRAPRRGPDERGAARGARPADDKRRAKPAGRGRPAEAPRGARPPRTKPSGDRPRGPSNKPRR